MGYPESLTDPSYRGQILVFTQPLIGNYGVPSSSRDENGLLKYFESPNMQACGVVVADVAENYSHWTAVESLGEWCAREGVPAISGVDTRAIVTYLREQGSSLARITVGEEYDADEDEAFVDPEQINLVRQVSTKSRKIVLCLDILRANFSAFHVPSPTGDLHVAVIDCGVKENILRSLVSRGASVTVFPYNYPIHKIAHHFHGVFISNGPGDPTHCQDTVYHLRKLMDSSQVPIMGICLGHQLVSLSHCTWRRLVLTSPARLGRGRQDHQAQVRQPSTQYTISRPNDRPLYVSHSFFSTHPIPLIPLYHAHPFFPLQATSPPKTTVTPSMPPLCHKSGKNTSSTSTTRATRA